MAICSCRYCLKRKYHKKAVGKFAKFFHAEGMISAYDRSANYSDNLRKDVASSGKKMLRILVNSANRAVSLLSPVFSGRRRCRYSDQNDPYLQTCDCRFHVGRRQSIKNHKEKLEKLRVEWENKQQGSPAQPQKLSTIEEEPEEIL